MQQPTRRVFCAALCQAAAGVASAAAQEPAALPIVRGQVDGDRVIVPVGSNALAEVGGRARVASNAGGFLVTRTGDRAFMAVTGTCSHEACQITDADANAFVCPCHGSRFAATGAVLTGPAEIQLQRYDTVFSGGALTITL